MHLHMDHNVLIKEKMKLSIGEWRKATSEENNLKPLHSRTGNLGRSEAARSCSNAKQQTGEGVQCNTPLEVGKAGYRGGRSCMQRHWVADHLEATTRTLYLLLGTSFSGQNRWGSQNIDRQLTRWGRELEVIKDRGTARDCFFPSFLKWEIKTLNNMISGSSLQRVWHAFEEGSCLSTITPPNWYVSLPRMGGTGRCASLNLKGAKCALHHWPHGPWTSGVQT